jgi:hypothetical protein
MIPVPGEDPIPFPAADLTAMLEPVEGLLGVIVWVLGGIAILRIVVGSFGVGKGSGGEG